MEIATKRHTERTFPALSHAGGIESQHVAREALRVGDGGVTDIIALDGDGVVAVVDANWGAVLPAGVAALIDVGLATC